LIEDKRRLNLEIVLLGEATQCTVMQLQLSLIERIKEAQAGDKQLQKFKEQVEIGLRTDLVILEDGSPGMMQGCVCQEEKSDKNY